MLDTVSVSFFPSPTPPAPLPPPPSTYLEKTHGGHIGEAGGSAHRAPQQPGQHAPQTLQAQPSTAGMGRWGRPLQQPATQGITAQGAGRGCQSHGDACSQSPGCQQGPVPLSWGGRKSHIGARLKSGGCPCLQSSVPQESSRAHCL